MADTFALIFNFTPTLIITTLIIMTGAG